MLRENAKPNTVKHKNYTVKHDKRLEEVLKKLESAGATLNAEKCEISKRQVKFAGYVLNQDGIISEPEKTDPIRNMDLS